MLITVVGKSCRLAVFITVKRHISRLGKGLFPFSSSMPSIAETPAGVAAFPVPKRFAIMFIVILFLCAVFGKRRFIAGESSFWHFCAAPPFSAMRKIPDQKQIVPASEIKMLTASAAPETPFCRTSWGKPKKIERISERQTIKVHTKFIMSPHI